MFDIRLGNNGHISLTGRLDSAQCDKARRFLNDIQSSVTLDCTDLKFMSSAGIGVLLVLQKRVALVGGTVALKNASHSIRDIFRYTGLEGFFEFDYS